MKINVCGVAFDDLDAQGAVDRVMGDRNGRFFVATPNALMLQRCEREPALRELLNAASIVLPDGMGVLRAAQRQGTPFRGRAAGIDFGERLLEAASRSGARVFLLGGEEGVAPMAAERLAARYNGLRICGSYWGYFEKYGVENQSVVSMIRACRPEILFVCFGFPTQERWILENLPLLPSVRVAAGLGGSLDVWSGQKRRAPERWQAMGMEWAWRMLHEPSRMRQLPELWRFYRGK